ncbi:MAG: thioredoxin-disulfide reductase [Butyricicoccus pullicaecorum]|nr:thioredoxin-disulfide reductase [Butyricicoccus pullicaecorum]
MNQLYDVVIVGGGPGGYTAALYCVRAGLRTLVLEKLSAGGQMATTAHVDNYPGFDEGIDGFALAERMQRGAERFGAVTEYAEVTSMNLTAQPKQIVTSAGTFLGKTVMLATGASPRMLGLPDEEALRGRGVSYCATCDGMFFRDKTVVVAGGGNSAAEDALTLSNVCKKVYLVHRRDSLRATQSYLAPLENAKNLEFVWNKQIDSLDTTDGHLSGIQMTDRVTGEHSSLPCDGLFVAIGRIPDTSLISEQVSCDAQGYIIADETTRTNLPGVFAVGDVRQKPLRQIITAAADGATASKFAEEFLQSL